MRTLKPILERRSMLVRTKVKNVPLLSIAFLILALGDFARGEDVIQVGYGEGSPGDTGIHVIVTATNDVGVHGFSLALSYPADVLQVTNLSVDGTHVQALFPEFAHSSVDNALGVAALGVILDFEEPVESADVPALEPTPEGSAPRIIARLTFDVKANAPGGLHRLRLVDGIGTPASYNRFTDAGTSITPRLEDGSFFVSGGNVLSLEKRIAFAGASPDLKIFAYAQHPDPIVGFSVAVRYDCGALELNEEGVTIDGTVAGFLLNPPEVFDSFVDTSLGYCRSATGVVFDFLPPFDETQVLPPETEPNAQSILRYSFNVLGTADDEAQFQDLILDELDIPGAPNNTFLVGDRSVTPRLVHGKIYFSQGQLRGRVVDILSREPVSGVRVVTDPDGFSTTSGFDGSFLFQAIIPGSYSLRLSKDGYYPAVHHGITVTGSQEIVDDAGDLPIYEIPETVCPNPPCETLFVRGRVNADSRVDIADSITLLTWLFQGGEPPTCLRSADGNNDDRVNIADAIYVLSWLFSGGPPPPPPKDGCGTDPEGSNLTCEVSPGCE